MSSHEEPPSFQWAFVCPTNFLISNFSDMCIFAKLGGTNVFTRRQTLLQRKYTAAEHVEFSCRAKYLLHFGSMHFFFFSQPRSTNRQMLANTRANNHCLHRQLSLGRQCLFARCKCSLKANCLCWKYITSFISVHCASAISCFTWSYQNKLTYFPGR